jgi:hypothetical protein
VNLAVPATRPADPLLLLTSLAFEGFAELGFQIRGLLLTVVSSHAVTLARLSLPLKPFAPDALENCGASRSATSSAPGTARASGHH